jgi:hypothetical protein
MNPALRGVLLAKSDHPPKQVTPRRASTGRQVSKAETRAAIESAVEAARAAIVERVVTLEREIAKREEIRKAARQEALHKILDGILEIEERVCKAERDNGGPDRVPVRKMPGLTPAQQLAELNSRTAIRKGLNGHGSRSMWDGVF